MAKSKSFSLNKEQSAEEIVIAVTGGVSVYKACEVVRALRKRSFRVKVLMSAAARQFIQPLLFQTLSGQPVSDDLFGDPQIWDPCHIALAERAAVIAVVPATAHTIFRLAQGVCDDLLSCVVTASRAPVVICPAMNDLMWAHPAVQENIRRLHEFGYRIIGPVSGDLACGRAGPGHLADVADIVAAIEQAVP